MAQWLNWGKGTSGSPNSISGTINTYATCTGTAGQTSLTTDLSASAGDQILIHQTQGTGAGNWEICEVVSDAGSTLNLKTALVNSYGTGSQAVLIPQYTGGNISGDVTGTSWNGSIGGIIALMSNGDLTISGSITAPSGFRGGAATGNNQGYQGESYNGTGSKAKSANNTGGGAGGNWGTGGGGGNGGNGENGQSGNSPGAGGGTSGSSTLVTNFFGGGGGAGSYNNNSKRGGNGSGAIFIFAKNLTVSGTVTATGETAPAAPGGVCGGGGAGGSILIKSQIVVLGTNKVTANGGARQTTGNTGGAGGSGRIHCDYFTSITGSTTPTLSSAQDTTLNVTASSGFFNFF